MHGALTADQLLAVKSWQIDFSLTVKVSRSVDDHDPSKPATDGAIVFDRVLEGKLDLADAGPLMMTRGALAMPKDGTLASMQLFAQTLHDNQGRYRSWAGPHGKPSKGPPVYDIGLAITDKEKITRTGPEEGPAGSHSTDASDEKWDGQSTPLLLQNVIFAIDAQNNVYDLVFNPLLFPEGQKLEHTFEGTHFSTSQKNGSTPLTPVNDRIYMSELWNDGLSKALRIQDQPLTTLSGTVKLPFTPKSGRYKPTWPSDAAPMEASFKWELKPAPLPSLELEVDIPNYTSWVPVAGKDEQTPGPGPLTLKLALKQKTDGSAPPEPIKSIVFELISSAERGICINYPEYANALLSLDLQFSPTAKLSVVTTQLGQTATADHPRSPNFSVVLDCFDYGAYGDLKVSGEMVDGRKFIGHLRNKSTMTTILIPARAAGSNIADAWKQGKPWANLNDTSDDEVTTNLPNNHNGDGLTLYEEYRGFYMNGKHLQGDPMKKDFFIVDLNSPVNSGTTAAKDFVRIQAGITLFASIGDMVVWRDLKTTELDQRMINFNSAQNHRQHGVIIQEPKTSISHFFQAVPRAGGVAHGTPENVEYIEMADDVFGMDQPAPPGRTCGERVAVTLAHELFHTCSVAHHGDSDPPEVWWDISHNFVGWLCLERSPGAPVGSGHLVIVMDPPVGGAAAQPHVFTSTGSFKVNIGIVGGRYSGDQDCVMRYDDENAYIDPKSPSNWRYDFQRKDCSGVTLCTGKAAPPNWPFGDATVGNCAAQFQVKDP